MNDTDILALARLHLEQGLCLDRTARITRSTDAELVKFARAVIAADLENGSSLAAQRMLAAWRSDVERR